MTPEEPSSQPERGFFDEYTTLNFDEYRKGYQQRQESFSQTHQRRAFDFSRLPLCQHSTRLIEWMNAQFPSLLEYPTPDALDQAILALSKEYWYRKQNLVQCMFYSCLTAVFEELLGTLMEQREELTRHPSSGAAAALYVGQDEAGEEDEAADEEADSS